MGDQYDENPFSPSRRAFADKVRRGTELRKKARTLRVLARSYDQSHPLAAKNLRDRAKLLDQQADAIK